MAWWKLRNQQRGGAELIIEMSKDNKTIFIREAYQSGEILIETDGDDAPEIDLDNSEGFNILDFDCESWEGGEYLDGELEEITSPQGLSDGELEQLETAYKESWVPGLEELGWVDAGEQQWWLHGPLELLDENDEVVSKGSA
jgi:hypothetical protein